MTSVIWFQELPGDLQTHIRETLKAEHGAGQLGSEEKQIKQRASELAAEGGFIWSPSRDWIQRLKEKNLHIPKRAYG